MSLTQKRILVCVIAVLYLGLCAAVFTYIGKPFIAMLDEPGEFQDWIASKGVIGPLVFFLIMMMQVFVAVMPGEPLEIAAGYTFGWLGGTLLAAAGIAVGQAVVFMLVKKFGARALDLFISRDKLNSVKFIRESKHSLKLLAILYFIPGTPKDLLTYCAGLLDIELKQFLMVTTIARLPSLVTSTIGGSALSDGNYLFAAIIFIATTAVSLLGLLIYSVIKKKLDKRRAKKNEEIKNEATSS